MKKLKCVCGSVLITLSFVFFVGIISSIAMMTISNALSYVSLISGIAQILYLLVVVVVLKLRRIDFKSRCGITTVSYKEYIVPAVAAICFSLFSNIMQTVIPIPEAFVGGMSDDMGNSMLAFVLAIFIIAPIVEEMTFRGLIMTKLRKEFSAPISILISALLFGIIHFMAGGLVTVIHAFLGGLIFALSYEKTKSILPTIVAHFFANVGGVLMSVIDDWSVTVQCVLAVIFLIVTILSCVSLIRKK